MTLKFWLNKFDPNTGLGLDGFGQGMNVSGGMVPMVLMPMVTTNQSGNLQLKSSMGQTQGQNLIDLQLAQGFAQGNYAEITSYHEEVPTSAENHAPVATFKNSGTGGSTSTDGVGYPPYTPLATGAQTVTYKLPETPHRLQARGGEGFTGFEVAAARMGQRLAAVGWMPAIPGFAPRSSNEWGNVWDQFLDEPPPSWLPPVDAFNPNTRRSL